MNKLVGLALRAPRIVIATWLVVVTGFALLALQLDGALSGGGFQNPRAEALVTQAQIEEVFGDAPNQFVVVLDGSDPVGDDTIRATAEALEEAGALSVDTPDANPDWRSTDGRTVLLVAGFGGDNTAAQNLTPALQSAVDAVDPDVSGYVTGQAALDYQLNAHSKEDAVRAELIVFPVLIVVLLFVFRSVVAMLLPLTMAGFSLAVASGVGFLLAREFPLSNLYTNIVSMIGLAVAVDYSLFIVSRFREELAAGAAPRAAVVVAMRRAGHSVLFSGLAVIVGLAALLIPQIMAFSSIALGGIIVTAVALLATHTALPAMLVLLGHNVDRWRIPVPARFARPAAPAARPAVGRARSALVGAVGIVAMLALAAPTLGLSLQSPVASPTILPADDPARKGIDLAVEKLGINGLFPIQVVISGEDPDTVLDGVQAATDHVLELDGVASATSVTTVGIDPAVLGTVLDAGVPSELQPLWSSRADATYARILVETGSGPDSVEAHELVAHFRAELPDIAGADVAVAGATATGFDFDATLVDALPLIAIAVFVLTFLLLAFAFRSLILPLLALLFNALVVGTSLGALTLVQGWTSDVPLNSVTPVLLFAVMFGLSMDYMVIIIARIVEAYDGGLAYGEAIRTGVASTRSMVNSAAVIMIAVFLSFMSGQISIVREIGVGLAIAVALDALVVRSIVMPAVLRALGPWVLGRRAARPAPERSAPAAPEVATPQPVA